MASLNALSYQRNQIDRDKARLDYDAKLRDIAMKKRGQDKQLTGNVISTVGGIAGQAAKGLMANHPSQHNKAVEYFKLATQISFADPLESHLEVSGTRVRTPGIMVINYIQVVGDLTKLTLAPFNNVFQAFYDHIRSANSGAVNNYDANDFAGINISAWSTMSSVSYLKRIIKLLTNESVINTYRGKAMFCALTGCDTTNIGPVWKAYQKAKPTLIANMVEWTQKLNQVPIPEGLDLPSRWIRFSDVIIADSDMEKSQYYVFKPQWFWRYDPTTQYLRRVTINWTDPDAVSDSISETIRRLFTATTVKAMFGDIMKLYDKEGVKYYTYYFEPDEALFKQEDLEIVHDEMMLDQIKNLISLPVYKNYSSEGSTPTRALEYSNFEIKIENDNAVYGGMILTYESRNATQTPVNGLRLWVNGQAREEAEQLLALQYRSSVPAKAYPEWKVHTLFVDADQPSADAIMMSSRLKSRYQLSVIDADYRNWGLDILEFNTEIVVSLDILAWDDVFEEDLYKTSLGTFTFYYMDTDPSEIGGLDTYIPYGILNDYQLLQCFNFHPAIQFILDTHDFPDSEVGFKRVTPYFVTLDNFARITPAMLLNLHRASVLSLVTPSFLYKEFGLTSGSDSTSKEAKGKSDSRGGKGKRFKNKGKGGNNKSTKPKDKDKEAPSDKGDK